MQRLASNGHSGPVQPSHRSDRPNFAQALTDARTVKGMSQEILAERSGLSVRAISDLERGRAVRPRRRSAQLLADALGLTSPALPDFLQAAGVLPDDGDEPDGLCTLPPAPVLAGRDRELAVLAAAADNGDAPAVIVLSGQPGVGKTALALTSGYLLADRYPDGQLYVSLRGTSTSPLSPAEALGRVLTAIGAGAALPAKLDELSALYHAQLHRRRLLLVLDDAADEAQVRPLLPVGDSLAVVTARRRLAGLAATDRLFLDVLGESEAARMVAGIAGRRRCTAEPDALRRVIAACGHLPLALQVAANRLASRPQWSLRQLADRLADEHRRLTELQAGDLTVRGPLEVSYRQLGPGAGTLFRRLALLAALDFDGALAAPLLDVDPATADGTMDELVEASMVEPAGPDRYQLHDLARLFAAGKLAGDPPAERDAARHRLDDFLLVTTIQAGSCFELDDAVRARLRTRPGGRSWSDPDEAARWLAREPAHWLAALQSAAQRGRHDLAVDVAEALHWYSDRFYAPELWPAVFSFGVQAAQAGHLLPEEAQQRNYLGWARHVCQGQLSAAAAEHRAAFELARRVGDPREQAWSLMYLGRLGVRDDAEEAVRQCSEAVRLMSGADGGLGTAQARFYLAVVLHEAGRYAEAEGEFQAAEAGHLSRLSGGDPGEQVSGGLAFIRLWWARNLLQVGRPVLALRTAQRAAEVFRTQRNQRGLARALLTAAEADAQRGDIRAAVRRLDVAADLFADLGATDFEAEALLVAAELYERVGRRDQARAVRDRAFALAGRIEGQRGRRLQERALGAQMPEIG